jgi:hypothetical protein
MDLFLKKKKLRAQKGRIRISCGDYMLRENLIPVRVALEGFEDIHKNFAVLVFIAFKAADFNRNRLARQWDTNTPRAYHIALFGHFDKEHVKRVRFPLPLLDFGNDRIRQAFSYFLFEFLNLIDGRFVLSGRQNFPQPVDVDACFRRAIFRTANI